MVTMSCDPSPATTTGLNPSETLQKSSGGYEKCREERIKENMERMQKLGILDLSLKLKSLNNAASATPRNRNRNTPSSIRKTPLPLPPSGPSRRSSRLQNSTPVSYAEIPLSKKDASLENDNRLVEEGSRPEIYTDEHEKLLGDTNMSWTLFVDGYGKDGKRIYDPVRGKTCHQCRQKTLGQRTHCSQCSMVQGQFCGDCLYMRYGENVLEANQNPNWICPVCRGICNCSLCRHGKGWAPTGTLYKKITNLGFKSVAHYLIQTHRANESVEKNSGTKVPVSAKRSLPFSDKEAASNEESPGQNDGIQGLEKLKSDDYRTSEDAKVAPVNNNDHQGLLISSSEDKKAEEDDLVISKKKEEPKSCDDKKVNSKSSQGTTKGSSVTIVTIDGHTGVSNCENNSTDDDELKGKKEDNELSNIKIAVESSPVSKKKRNVVPEATTDSIARRLRQRRGKGCEVEQLELVDTKATSSATSPQVDSIAGRLRQRCGKGCEVEKLELVDTKASTFTSPQIDSIAGRLRQRRQFA